MKALQGIAYLMLIGMLCSCGNQSKKQKAPRGQGFIVRKGVPSTAFEIRSVLEKEQPQAEKKEYKGQTFWTDSNAIVTRDHVRGITLLVRDDAFWLEFLFTDEGARRLRSHTSKNIGHEIIILINGVPYSTAKIQAEFGSGVAVKFDTQKKAVAAAIAIAGKQQ